MAATTRRVTTALLSAAAAGTYLLLPERVRAHTLTYLISFAIGMLLGLGAGFMAHAWKLYRNYSDAQARKTFMFSLWYLAALFAALLVNGQEPAKPEAPKPAPV